MDIGSLTGAISLQDNLSGGMATAMDAVKKFAEGFDGMVGAVAIGASIAVAAISSIVVSIVALGEKGSKIEGVTNAFDILAVKAGTTGDALRGALSAGVRQTVDDMDLMQATTKLLGSGMKLSTDQALLMGQAARELGKATGGDAASGLATMSSALVTGRVRGLQQQIGLIDLAAGEKKFADSIGVTVSQLNEAGKLEGKRIAILDATQAYLDRLGISELSFAEKVKQGWVAVQEWGDRLSVAVSSSKDVNDALDSIGSAISRAFGDNQKSAMDLIVSGINLFSRGVTTVVPYVVSFYDRVMSLVTGFENLWKSTDQVRGVLGDLANIIKDSVIIQWSKLKQSVADTWGEMKGFWDWLNKETDNGASGVMSDLALQASIKWSELKSVINGAVSGLHNYSVEMDKLAGKGGGKDTNLPSQFNMRAADSSVVSGFSSIAPSPDPNGFTKNADASTAQAALEASIAATEQLWEQYYGIVDKMNGDSLAAQLETDKRWYDGKLATLEKAKIKTADYNDQVNALDNVYIAKQIAAEKTFSDAEIKGTNEIVDIYTNMWETLDKGSKKFIDAYLKREQEKAQKIADASAAELANQYVVAAEYDEKNYQRTLGGTDLTIRQLDIQRQAAIKSLKGRFDDEGVEYQKAAAAINRFYDGEGADAKKAADTIGKQFSDVLLSIPATVASAFTGGGGFAGAVKSIGSSIGSIAGKGIAAAMSFAGPMGQAIGSAVGSLAGPLIGMFVNLFGNAGRQAVQKFADSLGGFAAAQADIMALGQQAGTAMWKLLTQGTGTNNAAQAATNIKIVQDALAALAADVSKYNLSWVDMADAQSGATKAGQTLYDSYERLIGAGYTSDAITKGMATDLNAYIANALAAGTKIPPGMQPIIEQLITMGLLTDANKNKLLGLSEITLNGGTFDDVMAAAGRYGLTLDDLGSKMNQLAIDKMATTLSGDWKLLTSDGENVNAVMLAMKDQVQGVLDKAVKFGDTIPDSMRPMIDSMIAAGLLTDGLGTKLIDDSKLNFAKPISASIDDLITKIGDLIDTLSHGITFPVNGKYTPDPNQPKGDGGGGGVGDGGGPKLFAAGGIVPSYYASGVDWTPRGTDTVPAMLTPGELVQTPAQQRASKVPIDNHVTLVVGSEVFAKAMVKTFVQAGL